MLQQAEPDDYVVATGETHSVRELVEIAFARVGLDWQRARACRTRRCCGPAEVDLADRRRAQGAARCSAGAPRVGFAELVEMMVRADLDRLRERPE